MFGVVLVDIRSGVYTLELAMDVQRFSIKHFLVLRIPQNGYFQGKLQISCLFNHYPTLSTLWHLCEKVRKRQENLQSIMQLKD